VTLYLVQHGTSRTATEDPGRGLSDEGAAAVHTIAGVARNYGVPVAAIVHSGKKRALQTAEILAAALEPRDGIAALEGIGPLDDVEAAAPVLTDRDGLMVVGHLPFLGRLASLLVTGTADHELFRFQNGGIVCLGRNGDGGRWIIRWSLSPEIG
jgi:phosphohistidine phosphatase